MSRPESALKTSFGCACLLVASLAAMSSARGQSPPSGQPAAGSSSGAIVESPEAMRVTTVIQCFCGTCSNQTLHECTCGTAASERAEVAAALAAGGSPEALIARYVAEHGPQVRIVPELRGLDIIGYSIPFAVALTGLLVLSFVLRGWQRRSVRVAWDPGRVPGPRAAATDASYRERLERDLRELDR